MEAEELKSSKGCSFGLRGDVYYFFQGHPMLWLQATPKRGFGGVPERVSK